MLGNAQTALPTFVADVAGTYIVQLIVNDGAVDSDPDTVVISTANTQPVADAGPDQTAQVGDIVQLNGNGSFDADGNPLTFAWSVYFPAGRERRSYHRPGHRKRQFRSGRSGTVCRSADCE